MATLFAWVHSAVVTAVIGPAVHRTIGFRVEETVELDGLDEHQHAESAYHFGSFSTPAR